MDQNSITSMSKLEVSPEESSWTFYFEDFLCNYDEPTSYSCDYESPSLISDAASSLAAAAAAAKKVTSDNDQVVGFSLNRSYSKSLSFKKRKTGGILVDDALEDTASSPVNSPKDSYFNQLELRRKDKEHRDHSEEKAGACGQADGRSDLGIVRRERDYTELKKRGLCLVPILSVLANNLG